MTTTQQFYKFLKSELAVKAALAVAHRDAGERAERKRIAHKLRGILVQHVVWPQATADAIYGLLHELDDQ